MRSLPLVATLALVLGGCSERQGGVRRADGSPVEGSDASLDGDSGVAIDAGPNDAALGGDAAGLDAGGIGSTKGFSLHVFKGGSDGRFELASREPLTPLLGAARPTALAAMESGKSGLQVLLADSAALSVLEIDADGKIAETRRTIPQFDDGKGLSACAMSVGDYDGDSNADVLAGCLPAEDLRLFRSGPSDLALQSFDRFAGLTVYDAELHDLDGDERAEVIALTQQDVGGSLSIEVHAFDPAQSKWSTRTLGTVPFRDGAELVFGDVNADSKVDVAVSDIYGVRVLQQEKSGFTLLQNDSAHYYDACARKAPARFIDLDADGKVDLFSWFGWLNDFECTYAASPEPLYGASTGEFQLPSGYEPRAIEVARGAFGIARINGDAFPDLVTLDEGAIHTRFGSMTKTWSAPIESALKAYLFDVEAWLFEDVDGDGVTDLLVVARGG